MTGRKTFNRGETVTAADMNGYFMDQGFPHYPTAAARNAAETSPYTGKHITRADAAHATKAEVWNGSSWAAVNLTSPAQTVQGQSSLQTFSAMTLSASTAANTWSSWTNLGTSPGSSSYLDGLWANASSGTDQSTLAVVELSLDGGTTVWRRFLVQLNYGGTYAPLGLVSARLASASSTVHGRFKIPYTTSASGMSLTLACSWTQTAPAIVLATAESLWETTTAGSAFGTWTTLGTVGAAHRLVAAAMYAPTDGGLASGAGNTVLARWRTPGHGVVLLGHNRAVPSGALKASGYSGSWAYVITEPV